MSSAYHSDKFICILYIPKKNYLLFKPDCTWTITQTSSDGASKRMSEITGCASTARQSPDIYILTLTAEQHYAVHLHLISTYKFHMYESVSPWIYNRWCMKSCSVQGRSCSGLVNICSSSRIELYFCFNVHSIVYMKMTSSWNVEPFSRKILNALKRGAEHNFFERCPFPSISWQHPYNSEPMPDHAHNLGWGEIHIDSTTVRYI